jgi:hypothetical protein
MKNLYNSIFFFKRANKLFEKLILLLSVRYAIACHAIRHKFTISHGVV